jgi:carbonic anhydrase
MKVLLLAIISIINSQQFNYQQLYHNGVACKKGRMQTPINLLESASNFNSSINILYDSYNVLNFAKLKFDERILYLSYDNENKNQNLGYVTLSRNGNLKKYSLKRIEIINPGEHQIEGQKVDLEIKFIHEQINYFETDVNQYRKLVDSNNNLIISILYNTTSLISDNGFLNELMATYNGNGKTNMNFDDYGLTRDRQFFFYEGSFSYSPCDESVNYVVFNKPFYISAEKKDLINSWYNSRYIKGNTAKVVAPLYGRKVYRNYALPHELSAGGSKSIAILIIFLFLL